MVSPLPKHSSWPPFAIDQLPFELQQLMEDFCLATEQTHPTMGTSPLITVVVPCFNPDRLHFAHLLRSLLQQSDQAFDLLLVNDGSSDDSWSAIQSQLDPHPWIKVLHQTRNSGISAALNSAVEHVNTPYVAFVDQDDLLHPGALALVHRHLDAHPDCGLLYTDHLVFDDDGTFCQPICKFPWNPEVLLEFNFLIHLTVLNSELYRASGGMNLRFDGIQDWEFYLRLLPQLTQYSVAYLPLPLYAWRLSDRSAATSACPKARLLELARDFLTEAHALMQTGCRPVLPPGSPQHYRFLVERPSPNPPTAGQACTILVLSPNGTDPALIRSSLQSVFDAGLAISSVFVVSDDGLYDQISGPWPKPTLLSGSLANCAFHLPNDMPLLALQAGVLLRPSADWSTLVDWLEQESNLDILTFPGFDCVSGLCVSAGYSSPTAQRLFHIPHAQGISAEAYSADFSSFGHTRAVDLPSPAIQLLSRVCVQSMLHSFISTVPACELPATCTWWNYLSLSLFRCACLADFTVELSASLASAERSCLAVKRDDCISLVNAYTFLASEAGSTWIQSYRDLVYSVLDQGVGRMHTLHFHAYISQFLHPAVRATLEKRSLCFTLLPSSRTRPVVILIPTELNVRSNGHACLLTLAAQLHAAGQVVYLLPFKPFTFFRHYLPRLPEQYRHLQYITHPSEAPGAVLLTPESAPVHLVNHLRQYFDTIIWWLLAPAGLLTAFRPQIRIGDKLIPFSEFALPNQPSYLFVHPPADPILKRLQSQHSPQASRYSQIALYTGKGRLRPLPRTLHRYLLPFQVVPITRSFPKTRSSLLRLLDHSKGLITCDPMTNLYLEAATLGLPTFLLSDPFPSRCYAQFPVDLRPWLTNSASDFISLLRLQGTRSKLPCTTLYLFNNNATDLFKLLLLDPEPYSARVFTVSRQTLREIECYRRDLSNTCSIQVVNNGQSSSSAYLDLYLQSLKSPYVFHVGLCHGLALLDNLVDILNSVRLYWIISPLLHHLARLINAFKRRIL